MQQLAINVAVLIIYKVYQICENQYIAKTILINVKKAFNNISQARLAQKMADLGTDKYLVS